MKRVLSWAFIISIAVTYVWFLVVFSSCEKEEDTPSASSYYYGGIQFTTCDSGIIVDRVSPWTGNHEIDTLVFNQSEGAVLGVLAFPPPYDFSFRPK